MENLQPLQEINKNGKITGHLVSLLHSQWTVLVQEILVSTSQWHGTPRLLLFLF